MQRSRLRSVAWWLAGSSCCAAPVGAAVWTVNRDRMFWPMLAAVVVAMTVLGERLGRAVRWLEPPVLAAVAYPLCIAIGLAIELLEDGGRWGSASIALLCGLAVGGVALTLRRLPHDPAGWFRRASLVWGVMSVLTVPLLGVGLLGVPQLVSYRLAALRLATDQRRSTYSTPSSASLARRP